MAIAGMSLRAGCGLPPSIGALTSLETLDLHDLHDNAITALPAELSQLTRLRVLYIKGKAAAGVRARSRPGRTSAVTLNTDTPSEVYLHL